MLTSGEVLIHDNAHPHSAAVTKRLLDGFEWDVFDHPAYNPDLAPSDYHLFPELRKMLGGQSFRTDDALQDAVKNHLKSLAANFYEQEIAAVLEKLEANSGKIAKQQRHIDALVSENIKLNSRFLKWEFKQDDQEQDGR
ncbi:histone-lysine N-methyltransferase SETMAR-like [Nilaparvata lugens]|uniref:histone-lysine N-methyltransferase SETMAR-like n=1 Tax=Nilaparvata lugens TaxID=108931 RepID=UPI00193E1F98|nr:histone-lysine N-methyltransferase SETMAR-like [Nilaparvata lugens]